MVSYWRLPVTVSRSRRAMRAVGKRAVQLLLHLLRADAQKVDVLALALGADAGHLFGVVAVVAQQAAVAPVIGQRDASS